MKTNKPKYYFRLLSFALTVLVISLSGLNLFQPGVNQQVTNCMMNSELTMGIGMTKYLLSSKLSLTDSFTPMAKTMGMMKGMMASNLQYDFLNLTLTLLLIITTVVLIGASIILIMLWIPEKKFINLHNQFISPY